MGRFSWMNVLGQMDAAPAAEPAPAVDPAAPLGPAVPVPEEDTRLFSQADRLFESAAQHLGDTFEQTPWTGWLMLLVAIFTGLAAGRLAQNLLRGIGRRMLDNGWQFRGTIFLDAAGPASLALLSFGLSVGLTTVALAPAVRDFVFLGLLPFLYILSFGWFLYNLVDLVDVTLRKYSSRKQGALSEQVIPLIRKTIRIFVAVVFTLFVAENFFDANIGAWLAGLGIAGLAVSLAAQDSIKNLFGSITIFMDRPYGLGDRIMVSNYDGVVEEIGFRSTKLRTLTGHLVTIPNSKMVDGSVENVARRPNLRRLLNVTITYDTPPEKIEQAVQIIRGILSEPEMAEPFKDTERFPPRVFFNDFNAASLNIIVLYWFYPVDWWAFQAHAMKFNLKLVQAFNEAGIEFAFPTQTLYLAGDPKRRLAVQTAAEGGDGVGERFPA